MSKILREVVLIALIRQISRQRSALWISLILVPSRILLMLGWADTRSFSGVIIILVVLVFIGGLLVLLVRVSSTIRQEQRVFSSNFVISFLFISFLFETKFYNNTIQIYFFSWIRWGLPSLFLFCVILLISLLLISWLSVSFKGALRGIYNHII